MDAASVQFVQRFGAAGKKFADTMRRWLVESAYPGARGERAKNIIMAAARQAKAEFDQIAKEWLKTAIPAEVYKGAESARRMMENLGKEFIDTSVVADARIAFGGVNERLAKELISDAFSKLSKIADSAPQLALKQLRVARIVANRDAEVSKALAEGVANQDTIRKLTKRVLSATDLEAGDPVVISNGNVWQADYYAETTARTRVMEASNESFVEQLKSYGQDYIFIPAHGGVHEDDICYALQGKVWGLSSDNDLGFPTLDSVGRGNPPWHPNCAHTTAPWVADLQDQSDIDDALSAHDDDDDLLSNVRN